LTLASVGQIVDCESFKDILMEDERTLQRNLKLLCLS
jgi:hypothetical protein